MGDRPGQTAVGIEGVDGFAQLGVAKAEGHLAVVKGDIRIHGRVIHDKQRNIGRNSPGILIDGDVLIFRLVDQQGRLEHLFFVPADSAIGILIIAKGIEAVSCINLPGMGCRMAWIR